MNEHEIEISGRIMSWKITQPMRNWLNPFGCMHPVTEFDMITENGGRLLIEAPYMINLKAGSTVKIKLCVSE